MNVETKAGTRAAADLAVLDRTVCADGGGDERDRAAPEPAGREAPLRGARVRPVRM